MINNLSLKNENVMKDFELRYQELNKQIKRSMELMEGVLTE
jgi:hypothetical protein